VKLAYKIPHRVTCRVVGSQFVAACSCKRWTKTSDLRAYAGLPGAWYESGIAPSVVGELIEAGHRHATTHVLEASHVVRRWAAATTAGGVSP
jgi:hypothetical protein